MRAVLVTMVLVVVGLVACDRDEHAEPTATPAVTATATPTSVAPIPLVPSTFLTAAPPPGSRLPYGVLLIDVPSGAVTSISEGSEFVWTRGFHPDGAFSVQRGREAARLFSAAGTELGIDTREPVAGCQTVRNGVAGGPGFLLNGVEVTGTCGPLSPDGRYLFYTLESGSRSRGERYEAWLLRLEDGTRTLLTDQLRHCGGCDTHRPPEWSPSGRYLIFSETGGSGDDPKRYHLLDVQTGALSIIPTPGGFARWSPLEDAFIAPTKDQLTVLTRLPSGERRTFQDVPWRSSFDDSGQYLFPMSTSLRTTTLFDVATGLIAVAWPGKPREWRTGTGIAQFAGRPIAALEGAPSCDRGLVLHHPQLPGGERCLAKSSGAEWAPDYRAVAFSREAQPIPGEPDRFRYVYWYWTIAILDVQSGVERRLVDGLRSSFAYPPRIYWNVDGTRLLVMWPGDQP